jgi:hypothetical protein
MRRSPAPSNSPGTFFAAQFSAGYTTNMSGFDLRQAQDVAIAHIDQMLAITSSVRDLPDARIEAILDWIEAEMLDHSFAWRERRLILFTEWDDMRAELGRQTGSRCAGPSARSQGEP